MIETSTQTTTQLTASVIPQTLAVSRIKTYTRKLAEIERFIEHYVDAPLPNETNVTVHTYWTAA